MIDLHTHILPAIDDGSQNSETSKEQLSSLFAQGVNKVAFTPHYYGKRHSPAEFAERRKEAFEEIESLIPQGMDAMAGAEVHFTGHSSFDSDDAYLFTLGRTRYILIEFPLVSRWSRGLFGKLRDFMYETDFIPVIAHVERYKEIAEKPSLLKELAEMDCLLQVNTQAFLNKEEKGLAFAALKHGLVHCLGTDTHNIGERAPVYAEAEKAIREAGFSEEFEKIQENMRDLWEDKAVKTKSAKSVKKLFGKYF